MSQNLLKNGGFEADWGEDESHLCKIFPEGGEPYEKDVGNIFTPSGWVTWFRHDPGTWDQPEVRDAWARHDPRRTHSGEKGMLLFTFFRKHDAGFFQRVRVGRGKRVSLTGWAHAWSNHKDGPHPSDGRWSEGAGYKAGFMLEGEAPDDNWRNFTFSVGIDPKGGTDPFADTVVWGQGAHIYNEYAQVPAVEATSQARFVTVFLRSKTLWPFKHSDAYWDDAELVLVSEEDADEADEVPEEAPRVRLAFHPARPKVGETVKIEARSQTVLADVRLAKVRQPSGAELERSEVVTGQDGKWHTWTYVTSPLSEVGRHRVVFRASGGAKAAGRFVCVSAEAKLEPRGLPRQQYERTYILLPPDAGVAWAVAAVDVMWDKYRFTIGNSADDAGIGDLDVRRVIAVNPDQWPDDLRAFFEEHYPGVEYSAIAAGNLSQLREKLEEL
jgi:hypothetical protein